MTLDNYLDTTFPLEDEILQTVKEDIITRQMPAIFVPPLTGALLGWLAKAHQSTNILEIGALGGYSGIWLARSLPDQGHLTSLELRPDYAEVARTNLSRAHLGDKVEYMVGPALTSLEELVQSGITFDFFFIDADKANYPRYLEYCLRLAKPDAIIAADNTLYGHRVLNLEDSSQDVVGIRQYNLQVAQNPRLSGLLVPVGDGLTLARVLST